MGADLMPREIWARLIPSGVRAWSEKGPPKTHTLMEAPYVRADIHDEAVRQRGRLLEAAKALQAVIIGPVNDSFMARDLHANETKRAYLEASDAIAECEASDA